MLERRAAWLAHCSARYAVSRSMMVQGEWLGRLYPDRGCSVAQSRNMLWRAVRDYLGVDDDAREKILEAIKRIGFDPHEFEDAGLPRMRPGFPDHYSKMGDQDETA